MGKLDSTFLVVKLKCNPSRRYVRLVQALPPLCPTPLVAQVRVPRGLSRSCTLLPRLKGLGPH